VVLLLGRAVLLDQLARAHEFGTMTIVTTSGEREAIRPSTSDCACGEKPSRHAP